MSDQNLKAELEQARALIRRLTGKLAQYEAKNADPRIAALVVAGATPEAAADALKAGFKPSGNTSTGLWTFHGEITEDLEGLASAWLDDHPWFRTAPAQTDNEPSADWPVDRNGNLIPITDLTDEQLYAVAGIPPKREQQQESYTPAELATMSEADRLAIQAGLEAKPDSKAKAEDREALEELNTEMDRRAESQREQAERMRDALQMQHLKTVWGGK